jgi:hypothetical protein
MSVFKNKENNLVKLIQLTTKSEKSYIKKYLNRFVSKEATFTTRLFDIYVKSDEINDEKFRIKLGVVPPIYANYKYQLYKLILQALTEISKNQSIQSQIINHLAQIEVLYNKSLFRDALTLIIKAKTTAKKHQEYRLLPQIIQWQMVVMQFIQSDEKDFTNEKNKLLEESISYLEIQKNITEYQQIKKDYQTLRAKYKDDQEKLISEAKLLLKRPILKTDYTPLSSLAKLHYYQLHYLINLGINLKLAHENSTSMLLLLQNELGEDYIKHNLSQYVDAHVNLLVSACEMKNEEGFTESLSNIEDLENQYAKTINKETAVQIFRSKYLLLCEHFYWFNATDKVIDSVPLIKSGIEKYKNKIRPIITAQIYFGIGNAFFQKNEFNRAIGWYSRALDTPKESMLGTTFIKANIMNLICYHETNYIHISHIIENTKKSLVNMPQDGCENQILKYIQNKKKEKPTALKEWPYLLWDK